MERIIYFQDPDRRALRFLLEESSRLFALSGGYRRPGVVINIRGGQLTLLSGPGRSNRGKGFRS